MAGAARPMRSNREVAIGRRALSGCLLRERRRDAFERYALGIDAPAPCDGRRDQHEGGAERITVEDRAALAGSDQRTKEPWRGDAACRRTERVEDRDRQCTQLQGKYFTRREIG